MEYQVSLKIGLNKTVVLIPCPTGKEQLFMFSILQHMESISSLVPNCCSPPSSIKFKNAWSYTSIPPYVSMVWCLVKHRISLHGVVLS
jgi:hypothetical protein